MNKPKTLKMKTIQIKLFFEYKNKKQKQHIIIYILKNNPNKTKPLQNRNCSVDET